MTSGIFTANIFFKQNAPGQRASWAFYQTKFGKGLGYGHVLIGSVEEGTVGSVVSNINGGFLDTIPNGLFSSAALMLGKTDFSVIPASSELFNDWLIDKTDAFWDSFDKPEDVIDQYLADIGQSMFGEASSEEPIVQVLYEQFKRQIYDSGAEIDPSNAHDWWSLAYGWALAKGIRPDDADTFARSLDRMD